MYERPTYGVPCVPVMVAVLRCGEHVSRSRQMLCGQQSRKWARFLLLSCAPAHGIEWWQCACWQAGGRAYVIKYADQFSMLSESGKAEMPSSEFIMRAISSFCRRLQALPVSELEAAPTTAAIVSLVWRSRWGSKARTFLQRRARRV